MSLVPLWSSVMLQSANTPTYLSANKSVKFTAENSKIDEKLIKQTTTQNTIKNLSEEEGWHKTDVVIKDKYFFLANIGTIVRKLNSDEFKKYECGSIHRIDGNYCVVLGIGESIYYNEKTGERYSLPTSIA